MFSCWSNAYFVIYTNTNRMSTKVSQMAETLIGSEIIKLGNEINNQIKEGAHIFNYTIGDFNPKLFPIPKEFEIGIVEAYAHGQTNYPPACGILELRKEVSNFLKIYGNLDYAASQILISGGSRPLIYCIYQTLLDAGDKVVFPIPSWNNNHYCHLTHARQAMVYTKPENGFLPTADELKPHLSDAVLLALCSPLNPTGTAFGKQQLLDICDLVVEENKRRGADEKPLYLMYDQMYWMLTSEGVLHYDPVSLRPDMKKYTLFVDGMSKAFAATGVRVGWAFGPQSIMDKMASILGHIGAWAPRAEQFAAADFLSQTDAVSDYLDGIRNKVRLRFDRLSEIFNTLKSEGFSIDIIQPQGAIYITVQFALKGKRKPDGSLIETTDDIAFYLLKEAQLGVVPFTAFGNPKGTDWFRVSIGTCDLEELPEMEVLLRNALRKLS